MGGCFTKSEKDVVSSIKSPTSEKSGVHIKYGVNEAVYTRKIQVVDGKGGQSASLWHENDDLRKRREQEIRTKIELVCSNWRAVRHNGFAFLFFERLKELDLQAYNLFGGDKPTKRPHFLDYLIPIFEKTKSLDEVVPIIGKHAKVHNDIGVSEKNLDSCLYSTLYALDKLALLTKEAERAWRWWFSFTSDVLRTAMTNDDDGLMYGAKSGFAIRLNVAERKSVKAKTSPINATLSSSQLQNTGGAPTGLSPLLLETGSAAANLVSQTNSKYAFSPMTSSPRAEESGHLRVRVGSHNAIPARSRPSSNTLSEDFASTPVRSKSLN